MKTSDKILETAQTFIQQRGYHAMSFDHVAKEVGIKKPSIVHHFPTKAALGTAVIQRYRKQVHGEINDLLSRSEQPAAAILDQFLEPFLSLGKEGELVCLCGSLAGEFGALPDEMRAEVATFFEERHRWLTRILTRGEGEGTFHFHGDPHGLAGLILDALQGALLVSRATRSQGHVEKMIQIAKQNLIRINETNPA